MVVRSSGASLHTHLPTYLECPNPLLCLDITGTSQVVGLMTIRVSDRERIQRQHFTVGHLLSVMRVFDWLDTTAFQDQGAPRCGVLVVEVVGQELVLVGWLIDSLSDRLIGWLVG